LFTMDLEILGKLTHIHNLREGQLNNLRVGFIQMLQQLGVVRADIPADDLGYAFRTIIVGFFLADPLFTQEQPDLERKGELLELTLRGAFGSPERPPEKTVRRIARHVHGLLVKALGDETFDVARILSRPAGPN